MEKQQHLTTPSTSHLLIIYSYYLLFFRFRKNAECTFRKNAEWETLTDPPVNHFRKILTYHIKGETRMITATITPRTLVIEGHAGYAPRGYDIVCEAVSILSETLAACYPPDRVTEITPGRAELDISNLTHDETVLLDAYITGMRMLEDSYPAHVRTKDERKTNANTPDTGRPAGAGNNIVQA